MDDHDHDAFLQIFLNFVLYYDYDDCWEVKNMEKHVLWPRDFVRWAIEEHQLLDKDVQRDDGKPED